MSDRDHKGPSWVLLKDLAQHDTDASVKAMAALLRRGQDAQAQLRLLIDYRTDYRLRLDNAAKNGIGGETLRNFRVFLGNLENAIDQQTNAVAQLQGQFASAKAAWEKHKRRVDSYQVLGDRQVTAARRAEESREQKQMDEMATRSYLKRVMGGDD